MDLKTILDNVISWLWDNVWTLTALVFVIRYGKTIYKDLFFTPLAGGNGHVQMDEAAKGVILGVFVFSAVVEAFRKTEYHVFSDAYYASLLLSVCAIAAIKPAFSKIKEFTIKKKDPE
jgi:hypothetical protein